jgi:hypothetical protein
VIITLEGAGALWAAEVERAASQLHDPACTCPRAIRSLGRLYGISMGKGWVRLSTDTACPVHASSVPS